MKINLEFERHDLEEMLGGYFGNLGFRIKNLQELCNQFSEAFPAGLVVQAEIVEREEIDELNETVLPYTRVEKMEEPEVQVVEEPRDAPRLSFTDLMDPTLRTREDDERDAAEIRKIREQSNGIAAAKRN